MSQRRVRTPRKLRVEKLEDRLVLSADPVGAIKIDYLIEPEVQAQLGQYATSLSAAHAMTGQNAVKNNYGFDGSGQTIAVIDSGVAWNHSALGGGFGANYKIVGGWDFTENDANPYDDGPAGSHGTHVSGIIGAENGANSGVATGADIVALRVFNDNGDGYFSWVEQALQWVHNNRNSFANPITTVNLSLGAEWNANTVPNWAMLEDEFAQLEADGIFISVAAGNSFTSYNAQGLSYPAVSSYVVPVGAVDANGNMAYFSQRNGRIIAAPGVSITSTVPDYVGNVNGIADDWASYSGTSMAAPYLAGASMLVRQAMQVAGWSNITQDAIYDVMYNTADWVYDSITARSYARLDLEAAVSSIMGTDDYGSTAGAAHNLGALNATKTVYGGIQTQSDADYFRFTATTSGTVTVTGTFDSGMQPNWVLSGGGGTVSNGGKSFTFNVTSGQSYTFGLSANKLGSYSLELKATSLGFTPTDLGAITQKTFAGLQHSSGDTWYTFTATRNGTLTAEALFQHAGGNVNLQLYDAQVNLLATSNSTTDNERIDVNATAGQVFYLKASGANSNVSLRLTNLVQKNGSNVDLVGTTGDDQFTLVVGATFELNVNGTQYSYASSGVSRFDLNGGAGYDRVTVYGGAGNESGTLSVGAMNLYGSGAQTYNAFVRNSEEIRVVGGGGTNTLAMYDSTGADTFRASVGNYATMIGSGYSNRAEGFSQVTAYSTNGGADTAVLYGGAGSDTLLGDTLLVTLYGSGYANSVTGFSRVCVDGAGGNDEATLTGSLGNDVFVARPDVGELTAGGKFIRATNFEKLFAHSGGGNDQAMLYDSNGNDHFYSSPYQASIVGAGFYNCAFGFSTVTGYMSGGFDTASMNDSARNDVFSASSEFARMYGVGFDNRLHNADHVTAYSNRGIDYAELYDTQASDRFLATGTYGVLYSSNYWIYARGFETTTVYASGGDDFAWFYGTAGDETLDSKPGTVQFIGAGFHFTVERFERVTAYSGGGTDRATFVDDPRYSDSFYGAPTYSMFRCRNNIHYAFNFAYTEATASGGTDQAYFYDSAGNDKLSLAAKVAIMQGSDFYVTARGFKNVFGFALSGGNDELEMNAIDFVFSGAGNW